MCVQKNIRTKKRTVEASIGAAIAVGIAIFYAVYAIRMNSTDFDFAQSANPLMDIWESISQTDAQGIKLQRIFMLFNSVLWVTSFAYWGLFEPKGDESQALPE